MTDEKPKGDKPKKKRFKYTLQLVRIAIEEGMKQVEIADLCRVQQSKVSAWFRGDSKAFEHEIAPLKKRFGHRLNRTTSRVYLVVKEEEPQARWEDSERGRRLLELHEELRKVNARLHFLMHGRRSRVVHVGEPKESPEEPMAPEALEKEKLGLEARKATLEAAKKELQASILPGEAYIFSPEGLIRFDQDHFEATRRPEQVTQVEGPVVLRYTFVRPELVVNARNKELKRQPIARWLVHSQPDGKFVLVMQLRRTLVGVARWRWWNALELASATTLRSDYELESKFSKWEDDAFVECADDAARWLSFIRGPMDATALLSHCDKYFSAPGTLHSPHDEATLPFLLRKMLVEQGEEVPGLVRLFAAD